MCSSPICSEEHLVFYHIFFEFFINIFEFLNFETKNPEIYRNFCSRCLAKTGKIPKFRRKSTEILNPAADRGARGSSCRSVIAVSAVLHPPASSPGAHPDPPGGEGSWWVALRSTSTGACLHSVLSAGPGVVVYHHRLSLVQCRWSAAGYERARINREP